MLCHGRGLELRYTENTLQKLLVTLSYEELFFMQGAQGVGGCVNVPGPVHSTAGHRYLEHGGPQEAGGSQLPPGAQTS